MRKDDELIFSLTIKYYLLNTNDALLFDRHGVWFYNRDKIVCFKVNMLQFKKVLKKLFKCFNKTE